MFQFNFIYISHLLQSRSYVGAETKKLTLKQATPARTPPPHQKTYRFLHWQAFLNACIILNSLGLYSKTTCHKHTSYFSASAALSLAQVSKGKLKTAMRVKWGSETSETKSGLPESRPPQLSFLTSEHLLSKGYPSPLLQDYWGQRNQHTQRTMLKTKGKTNTKGWRKDFQLHAKETSHLMARRQHIIRNYACVYPFQKLCFMQWCHRKKISRSDTILSTALLIIIIYHN